MSLFAIERPKLLPIERPTLLPIQLDLLQRGRRGYTGGIRRAIWQAPCAFGKTWVAAEQIALALAMNKRVLFIVHRRRLVDQMIRTLGQFRIHASPLMQGRLRWDSPVVCASRDTLLAMLKDGAQLPPADLIIIDECHAAAALILDYYLTYYPYAYWTGYTATPVGADGRSLKPPYQALVCSAPPSELIRLGRLVPVKVYNCRAQGERRARGETVKPVGDPVMHWRKYAEDKPTVVYARTVAESLAVMNLYRAAGITAEHIDASTPDEDREAVFDRSERGETTVICNVGILVEGVDLPWLGCCQILRGCNSIVLWFQANGRVMRAFPGKTHGICLDHANAADEFGLPDRDFPWSLDDEATLARAGRLPKERRPITCPHCGIMFSPKPACPECGHVLPRKRRKSLLTGLDHDDGLLTRYEGQNDAIENDRLERLFKKCFYITRAKGGRMSQVNAIFTRHAGKPAWEVGLSVRLPGKGCWGIPANDWQL
jgi:superfamily II DNA or RNA helicase